MCYSCRCLYLLVERPFEQSITLAPHHYKEEGQVAPAPRPISVQVDSQAHLVAVLTGVEGWRHKGLVQSVKRLQSLVVNQCSACSPGENMAGARPAMASCLFLAKSEMRQTKTPSKVVADISLRRPSISATVRSFSPTVLSSCRTWDAENIQVFNLLH